jgi:hypothetical protein
LAVWHGSTAPACPGNRSQDGRENASRSMGGQGVW